MEKEIGVLSYEKDGTLSELSSYMIRLLLLPALGEEYSGDHALYN